MPNPRIPPGLKLLRADPVTGRDNRGRRAPTVANLQRTVPDMPDYVRKDPVALTEWNRVIPILMRCRLLHDGSSTAVGLYCAAVSRAVAAHRDWLAGTGTSRVVTEHDRAARSWAGELGLTPASEHVLTAAADRTPDEDDPFA